MTKDTKNGGKSAGSQSTKSPEKGPEESKLKENKEQIDEKGNLLFEMLIDSKSLEERYKEKIKYQRQKKEEELRLLEEQKELKRKRDEEERQKRLIPQNKVFFEMEKKWIESDKLSNLHKRDEVIFTFGVYRGYVLNGKRHGPGTYRFNNMSVYNGEFADDAANGYG